LIDPTTGPKYRELILLRNMLKQLKKKKVGLSLKKVLYISQI
jgi:hypothetical protein